MNIYNLKIEGKKKVKHEFTTHFKVLSGGGTTLSSIFPKSELTTTTANIAARATRPIST